MHTNRIGGLLLMAAGPLFLLANIGLIAAYPADVDESMHFLAALFIFIGANAALVGARISDRRTAPAAI